ncbi:minor tail protein [Microbacterium phage Ixel]|nr:minor tail protein [Microbacterium phage Ixel]
MAERSVDTGTAGRLTIQLTQIGVEPWNNRSLCRATLIWSERSPSTAWNAGSPPIPASTTTPGFALWSGGFGFDWRPAGLQSQVLNTTDFWVSHNPEGYGSMIVAGSIGNTGSSSGGSGASVDVFLDLGKLTVAPGQPTGLTATRVSDTQVKLDWTNNEASNGAATLITVQRRINGGSWVQFTNFGRTNTVTVDAQPNQKVEYQIIAGNSAGNSPWSAVSNAIYTTPAAPSGVAAAKDSSGNIDITFTENVAYSEHTHEIWHGTVSGGVTTWDGAALTTLASGVTSYEHATPNPAQQHRYRVRSKAGTLTSAWVESNTVVLLTAPAKPTIPPLASFFNRAAAFRLPWVHNSIDSSPQSKYQWRWSTNGGSTWTTGAKTASTNQYHDFAANTWAANATVTFQVRTKGAYDSGSDGDASYSPWSDSATVTFKSLPTATITAPANGSTINDSTIRVDVGFAQAEAATFVKAQLELLQGATLLETAESTNQIGITLTTPAQNGVSYTVRARVQDSNGLWSAWATSTFSVTYLAPVPAVVTASYVESTGYGQLDLTIAAPGVGQAAATTVTITRTINGVTETVVENYPVSAELTFLDTTPTIHGTNEYVITTNSALGAKSSVSATLVTNECRRAFLSKGPGFASVGAFGGNLEVNESLSVASATVEAAGRTKPIGLYGTETNVQLKVKSFVFPGFGSSIDELRAILLLPGKACFRDASGRRVFGTAKGGVAYKKSQQGDLSFTITETS